MIISAPLCYLVYRFVEPTYRASSRLLLNFSEPDLFGPGLWSQDSQAHSLAGLQTAMAMIQSNQVLGSALADTETHALPGIRQSPDPMEDLKNRLEVRILPGTYWIEVALESPDPREATEIVNSVVTAFQRLNETRGHAIQRQHIEGLSRYMADLDKEIQTKRHEIVQLAKGNETSVPKAAANSKDAKAAQPTLNAKGSDKWPSLTAEIEAGFLKDDLRRLADMRDTVNRKLEQLKFVADRELLPDR